MPPQAPPRYLRRNAAKCCRCPTPAIQSLQNRRPHVWGGSLRAPSLPPPPPPSWGCAVPPPPPPPRESGGGAPRPRCSELLERYARGTARVPAMRGVRGSAWRACGPAALCRRCRVPLTRGAPGRGRGAPHGQCGRRGGGGAGGRAQSRCSCGSNWKDATGALLTVVVVVVWGGGSGMCWKGRTPQEEGGTPPLGPPPPSSPSNVSG